MPAVRYAALLLGLAGAAMPCALVAAPAAPVVPADGAAMFEGLRATDVKLATIGFRLATANAALCDRLEPGTGLQLQTADQFDGAARAQAVAHFRMATPLAIEGVVPGSPAEQAGLRADDSIVRIGPVVAAEGAGESGSTARLVAAQTAIQALDPSAPIEVDAIRDGTPLHATIRPVPACRSRFELRVAEDMEATGDGTMVQVSSRYFERFPDDQIVAVVAHEFAHNILRHHDRLEAVGVDYGLLSGFGGNVKYFRQVETQADIVSVALMLNAGYDPNASIAFWRVFGPKYAGGMLRARTHPAWRDRIATIEQAIAQDRASGARPVVPDLIAQRDQPLDGDWQAILVRH